MLIKIFAAVIGPWEAISFLSPEASYPMAKASSYI